MTKNDENTVRQRRPLKQTKQSSDKKEKKSKGKSSGIFMKVMLTVLFLPIALLALFISFAGNKINAVHYELPTPPAFKGPLSENNLLTKAKRLLEDEIAGPESLLLHKDSLFTGLKDGRIIELKGDKLVRVLRQPRIACSHYDTEQACGRPLGLRNLDENNLVYADAYLGLIKLDLSTGNSEILVEGGNLVEGRPLGFTNDLAVLKNGTILFTDSSSLYQRRDFLFNILEHAQDGRLLSFDTTTKQLRVLLDNIAFANGVEISPDEQFALVSELSSARILKYNLKGNKAGKVEIFAENLPGLPDNIRLSPNGSYWVGLAMPRQLEKFSPLDFLSSRPAVRNVIAKLLPAKHVESLLKLLPSSGLAILIDKNGKIVSSLHDPKGSKIQGISEIADTGKSLYIGSFNAPYLSKLDY